MTAEEFLAARAGLRLTQLALADALGVTPRTVKAYEAGAWGDGTPAAVPRMVELALEALAARRR